MALCNIHGEPIAADIVAKIVKHNMFDNLGGIFAEGYNLPNTHKLTADENYDTIYAKLPAGGSYLFAFDDSSGSTINIHVTNALPDVETLKNTALNYTKYRWVYNFFNDIHTETGSYIYRPETDVYIMAGVKKGVALYIWDGELTGDIHPGTVLGNSFLKWNQNDTGYSGYPFGSVLDGEKTVEVPDDFCKGAIRANDINRIYGGNVPLVYIGDSIVVANSVGLENCYRKNSAKALDLPWSYHAANGATITDGYGMTWDGGGDTAITGYSGFVATETAGKAKGAGAENLYKQAKMVILALGTNDFGNSAPLGTVLDTGTSTFYGAFRAFLNYFRNYNPNIPVIVVTPFKRDTWATENAQGLILPDYIHAMYVVTREFERVYILDVFSKWYSDTDNEAIRERNSVDGIHPSAWFHDCFTMDLVQKIKEVCALEGIIA